MGKVLILEPLKSRRSETECIVLGFFVLFSKFGSVLVMFLIKEEVQIHSPFLGWKPVSNTGECQLISCCLRHNQKNPHESQDNLADCLRPSIEWGCGPRASPINFLMPLVPTHLSFPDFWESPILKGTLEYMHL